ncbi:hypothetical protein F6X40_30465 [Paraburkholderia sp. UCT31]|uniref:hypothetical protein n=1 Tax=Paraburkholderia sp. UCT31 TaxID=2615209 RepID=UPI0016565324|nr:hypothetical protein [Paraburkholderia sp. UCT31]MBC8740941.1 hypothetical protein [Paraburkholderia sp. UCT31]
MGTFNESSEYHVVYEHHPCTHERVDQEKKEPIELIPDVQPKIIMSMLDPKGPNVPPGIVRVGDQVTLEAQCGDHDISKWCVEWPEGVSYAQDSKAHANMVVRHPGRQRLDVTFLFPYLPDFEPSKGGHVLDAATPPPAKLFVGVEYHADETPRLRIHGDINTRLDRTVTEFTSDVAFWTGIQNCTNALSFDTYQSFMSYLFDGENTQPAASGFEQHRFPAKRDTYRGLLTRRALPFTDTDAYRILKAATEAFVMVNCGVLRHDPAFDRGCDDSWLERRGIPVPGTSLLPIYKDHYMQRVNGISALPYLAIIRSKLPDVRLRSFPNSPGADMYDEENYAIMQQKLRDPCLLELLWSYWHEEGMTTQTVKAVERRFQNVRSVETPDPLANLEMDPLRPLATLMFGHCQDEQHRLTVVVRNYEYDHQYGLRLQGKAVQDIRPADSRSKFIEAFHNLLRLCAAFYRQDDDTTVKADAFPVLNALKEVHLILSQASSNGFGDLPSTARIEMLMEQWLLARPEFREYLPTRIMVAYPEAWMDRVDAMKKLQGWTDTSVLHFHNLGVFGEQILLSIRWGAWSPIFEPVQAFNWARFWRPQIQGYTHAYRAATGVDLTAEPGDAKLDAMMPSVLLQKRLALQERAA